MLFILLFINYVRCDNTMNPISDSFIDYINRKQTLWRAGRNFHPSTPLAHILKIVGVQRDFRRPHFSEVKHTEGVELPEFFDARTKWPKCPSINDIYDQGSCGSDWAISVAAVLTDRFCIRTHEYTDFKFSAYDLLSCCLGCGGGCEGGSPAKAWQYALEHGIVSDQCRPYEIPSSRFNRDAGPNPQCTGAPIRLHCSRRCSNLTRLYYEDNKHYVKSIYSVQPKKNDIKREMFLKGPVQATMSVYEDFYSYKSGIYRQSGGDFVGYHAVKLLGWGTDGNGYDYWLAANSWGREWGAGGFFKILSDEDHCGIEKNVIAPIPKTVKRRHSKTATHPRYRYKFINYSDFL